MAAHERRARDAYGRIRSFLWRSREVLVLAALVGALTGLGVEAFEWLTREVVFDRLLRAPLAVEIAAPVAGMLLAAAALHWVGRTRSPSTTDEYIRSFHDQQARFDLRPVPGRLLASVATLGLGGAMGYEGPSMYLGAAAGSALRPRLGRYVSRRDAKTLLVCGAAAGIAAIFKAPATGLVYALEVPYRQDFARRMLLPAGIAAAASYLVFVAFNGTRALVPVVGAPPLDFKDLAGSILLGVVCGIGARYFTIALMGAKHLAERTPLVARALGGGLALAGLAALSHAVLGRPLTLGAGYDNLVWAFDAHRALWAVVALLLMRAAATVCTVGAGGAGGLFIPLVIEGALVGRAIGGVFGTAAAGSHLFTLIGVSAFLGAGYRVPLAGVVFAAEASGRPGFIVPGLIAAVVAQLFMGSHSASPYQRLEREDAEDRDDEPVTSALTTRVALLRPEASLADLAELREGGRPVPAAVVVDGSRYRGIVARGALDRVPPSAWGLTPVGAHTRVDHPTGDRSMTVRDALRVMAEHRLAFLPILADEEFVGLVTPPPH